MLCYLISYKLYLWVPIHPAEAALANQLHLVTTSSET